MKITKEIGDRGREGRVYGNLGGAYCSLGGYRKSIQCVEKNLKIPIEMGDRGGEGGAYANIGVAYSPLGDY